MVAVSFIRVFIALNLGLAVAATYIPRAAPGTQFITGPCKSDSDCASKCCGFHSGKCAGPVIAQQRDGGCGFGDAQPNNKAAQAIQGANAILPGGKGNGIANGDSAPKANAGGAAKKGPKDEKKGKNDKKKGTKDEKKGKNDGKKGKKDEKKGKQDENKGKKNENKGAAKPAKKGTQFITGACKSDSDCASSCCGFHSGKCAGPIIAQTRDGGCGFGDAKPNDRAAKAFEASHPGA